MNDKLFYTGLRVFKNIAVVKAKATFNDLQELKTRIKGQRKT